MSHIPFDTRSVKYDEHHFIKEISKNENGIPNDSLHEPYDYFNGESPKRGSGFGNVRHQRKKTFLNRKQAVEAANIEKPEDLKGQTENHDTVNKGIGVLVEPASSSENKASVILVSNHSERIPKNRRPVKRKSKKILPNSPNISVEGRSAFKPSLIQTSDHSPKSPQNRKRSKKDIFGIY